MADDERDKPGNGKPWDHLVQHQFKPGQSGNPKGRPKRKSVETMFREVFDEFVTLEDGSEQQKLELFVRVVVDELIFKRNTRLIVDIMERVWPKTHHIDLTRPNEGEEVQVPTEPRRLEEVTALLEELTGGKLH